MRRGSVVGPLILITIGALFLINNLSPDLSMIGLLGRFWPWMLIAWGVLRLLEIGAWAMRRKPLPTAGISGGEWVAIVFISILGSGVYFVSNRAKWPPVNIRLRGIEMLGEAFDYPIAEKIVQLQAKAPRVVIENMRGNARITGGSAAEVRVSGRKTVRAMSRDEAERASGEVKFEVVREGDTVFVRQAGSRRGGDDLYVSTDLEITVPAGSRLEARGRRGDFDVTGIDGDIDINSDNAGVRLENIGGNVRVETRASDIIRAVAVKGGVELKGSGHDIDLENVNGPVVVSGVYFGDLQFRGIPKPVRFESGDKANTEWRVEACPGQIRMTRGNLALENVTGPVLVTARSKDVQVSGFTQGLDLRVDRGDLEVRAGVNPVPRMTVSTNAGNVELTLPDNGKFALKATVDKGEVENDYGDMLNVREEGRGGTITGTLGGGSDVTVYAGRGSVRVRRGSAMEAVAPLPPRPPKPISPDAAKSLVLQRN